MAQGNHKLSSNATRKSSGSRKRQAVKLKKKTKKGNTKVERNAAIKETTKAINRKNERVIASVAMNAGTNFYLKDISTKGKNESKRRTAERDKKQNKPTKMSDRLAQRLDKMH